MITEKQKQANRKNALSSTGPKTPEGKGTVSQNAVKHGIFTKDLIISKGDGQESEEEYQELLEGLMASFNPVGQAENLLVEKIAADFWRLRRVLRYETGCIRYILDTVIGEYYSQRNWVGERLHRTEHELDGKLGKYKYKLKRNTYYIELLQKGLVKFDNPIWEGEGLEVNIEEDLRLVIQSIYEELVNKNGPFRLDELDFKTMKTILKRAEYTDADISSELIQSLAKQNRSYDENINMLNVEKFRNFLAEEVITKINVLPAGDAPNKVLKYETTLQRSIFQNIALLKRLQTSD